MSHSGFEHVFCYGDVLLSFIWSHEDEVELKRKNSTDILNVDIEQIATSTSLKHDFIRTQFHRTTHCDFCSKKVLFAQKSEFVFLKWIVDLAERRCPVSRMWPLLPQKVHR